MKYRRNFYEIKSNDEIHKKIVEESQTVGYYSQPFQDISEIVNHSDSVSAKDIVLIGIGGSSLGARAIYNFLYPVKKLKKLKILDTVDPLRINQILKDIDLHDSHFVIVSKSGQTTEPISIIKYLKSLVELTSKNTTIISGAGSKLYNFGKSERMKVFSIPENVGGRFSVFSVAGLVPLSMIGVDIREILNGCRKVHQGFFDKGEYCDNIINKARFLVENKSRFRINVIFSYSSIFKGFNRWFTQIWAESLGKKNINNTRQGLTPVALLGPDDQHCFLQLIIDGVRDKTITFIKIENLKSEMIIPNSIISDDFESDLSNLSFNQLLNLQADATIQSIEMEKDIPCDVITISTVDEYNIATLMFRFQMLVSCIGAFLQINTYDQPGVENGKSILKKNLKNV